MSVSVHFTQFQIVCAYFEVCISPVDLHSKLRYFKLMVVHHPVYFGCGKISKFMNEGIRNDYMQHNVRQA